MQNQYGGGTVTSNAISELHLENEGRQVYDDNNSELGSGFTAVRKVFDQVDLKSKITESVVINDDVSDFPRMESNIENLKKK